MEKLYQLMGDKVDNYITFFSLRAHGMVGEVPKTELIYIHSKILLVDDEIALIGSANINDRSMLGNRDSEVAVVIRDDNKIPSRMNGSPYQASKFVKDLRVSLLKEHLGIDDRHVDILSDPLSDGLYEMMRRNSYKNTKLYREIFGCYPDDKFKKFEDMQDKNPADVKAKYIDLNKNFKGNIVEFPLNFLKEEYLNRTYFCKEILVPIKNFL
jgi:phospholipase D1/2